MMIKIFAITTRGLEDISAEEMKRIPGMQVGEVSYRKIRAVFTGDLKILSGLRTVDDLFIDLDIWKDIATQRSALEDIQKRSSRIRIEEAVRIIQQVRSLPDPPIFSVTANFVGKRNYSYVEIKQAVSNGILQRRNWQYRQEDHESQLNIRVFIEHHDASVGIRLAKQPLHKREYKNIHIAASLKPPVAAAMISLVNSPSTRVVLDPFCGAGTILIEASFQRYRSIGGDANWEALWAAKTNIENAGIEAHIYQWDARSLPFSDQSIECIVTNLPWGRQISVGPDQEHQYYLFLRELQRILHPQGRAIFLTNSPEQITIPGFRTEFAREISLFGQTPTIVLLTPEKLS